MFTSSKLGRPTYAKEPERLRAMLDIENHLIVSAWDGKKLVGLAVALCDGAWVCFLRDVAVTKEYEGMGKARFHRCHFV